MHGPGALKWGRLSSIDRTEADLLPGSSPVPQRAFAWKKEAKQDLQKQLYFQDVNGLDGARRSQDKGKTQPIN